MSKRPTYPKPDANQAQIRADLRKAGFPHIWLDVSSLPVRLAGVDAFVIAHSITLDRVECLPVEIKMPGEKLNENERVFFDSVAELGFSEVDIPIIARQAEHILAWFGWM